MKDNFTEPTWRHWKTDQRIFVTQFLNKLHAANVAPENIKIDGCTVYYLHTKEIL